MKDQSPIDEYLRRFRLELRGVRWWRRRGIVAEVRGHLEDVAAEERAGGCAALESERRAVARFGDPAAVASQFRSGHRRGRLMLAGLAAIGVVVVVAVVHLGGRSKAPEFVRATRPPIVGGTLDQRQLIGRLSRPFPLPGVTELRIDNGYRNPRNRHWHGALILVSPTGRDPAAHGGWVGVANAWAGSAIVNAYYASADARRLPGLANVLTGNDVSGLTVGYRQDPTTQPIYPYTSAAYRHDVEKAVAAAHVTLIRAALIHEGGWNSYIEVEVKSPKTATRVDDGFADNRRLTGSLVLIDNACGQPLVADSLYADGSGYDWADSTWRSPHTAGIVPTPTTHAAAAGHGASCTPSGVIQTPTITVPNQPAGANTQQRKVTLPDPVRGRQVARALTPRLADFGPGWRQLPNGDPMRGYRCDPGQVGVDELAQTTHPARRFSRGQMTVTAGAQSYRTLANAHGAYGRAIAAKRIDCLAMEVTAAVRRDAPPGEVVGPPAVGFLRLGMPVTWGVGAHDWQIRIPVTTPTGAATTVYVDVYTLSVGHGLTEITMVRPGTPFPKGELEQVARHVATRGMLTEDADYKY